jgi:hypothetical protein
MRMGGDVSAVADVYTPVSVYSTQGAGGWIAVGGTSASSPLVAGALTALGVANGHFSPAWIWQHTGDFYDVTTGSNGSCSGYVCNAGPGYDGPTGWGTPNGKLLATDANGGTYAAQFVGQSFPLATTSSMAMVAGQVVPSYVELKNVGTKTWDSNTRLATSQPRDRASAFADKTWLASNRLASVTGTVPPGGTYKFTFDLAAPTKPGSYDEFFGVVEEGVAWFSDPGQGGPADDFLEVKVDVTAGPDGGAIDGGGPSPTPDAGHGSSSGGSDGGLSGPSIDAGEGVPPGGADGGGGSSSGGGWNNATGASAGCALGRPGRDAGGWLGLGGVLLALAIAASRRRR